MVEEVLKLGRHAGKVHRKIDNSCIVLIGDSGVRLPSKDASGLGWACTAARPAEAAAIKPAITSSRFVAR